MADAYGFPSGEEDEQDQTPGFEVASVFLSKRKGALLIRLATEQEGDITSLSATGRLTYTTPDGEDVEEDLEASYEDEPLDERGQYFEQPSVGKTVALALLVDGMHEAAEQYADDSEAAVATMGTVVDRFAADAEALDDDALTPELELARELLRLMESGAEQGDLYGYGIY